MLDLSACVKYAGKSNFLSISTKFDAQEISRPYGDYKNAWVYHFSEFAVW